MRETIDAGAMLKTSVHPLGKVRHAPGKLFAEVALLLLSPCWPEPLIAELSQVGFAVHSYESASGEHNTLIARA